MADLSGLGTEPQTFCIDYDIFINCGITGRFVEKLLKCKNWFGIALSAKNKIKTLLKKTRPTKDLKRPGAERSAGKIDFTYRNCLRSWSAPRPRHPDDIGAEIWVKNT